MYFDSKLCMFQVETDNRESLLKTMAEQLYSDGFVRETYYRGIMEREKEYPTGLWINGTGFAIPHTDSSMVKKSQICFASLKNPVEFYDMAEANKKVSVELVFMLAMSQPHEQADLLQNLIGLFQDMQAIEEIKRCKTKESFMEIINRAGVY